MIEFKLPAIGEGVVEGEIVRWLKQPGDNVSANEPLVEVMTDKATVEIPSPHAGTVQEHKADEGAIAAVGEVIALIGDSNGAAAAPPTAAATPTPPPAAPATPQAEIATIPPSSPRGKVLATPAARALARESGIDLGTLPAERGRITKADVVAARDNPQPVAPQSARPTAVGQSAPAADTPSTRPTVPPPTRRPLGEPEADELIPFRGMRRRIAQGLHHSYSTAVHYTYVEEINVTKLVGVRKQAKAAAAEEGVSLSYLPFIIKAVIRGLKRYPIVNAMLDEEAQQIVVKKRYDIGVATATDQGLLVPVLRDADRLSLLDVAREVARLSDATRNGQASRDELSGSTFTITSLGVIGGLLATPILNFPEVGILGVHAIRKKPVVDDNDNIVVGHMMNLSVSLDHRIVDGFEGASFLQEVKRYLEDPTLLLLAGI